MASAVSGNTGVAATCIAFLVLAAVIFVLCRRKRAAGSDGAAAAAGLLARSVPLSEVVAATDGFAPSRAIGSGRLGTVYKAVSANGDVFAVKRIHPDLVLANPGLEFAPRIRSLSLANHPNVAPILSYSEAPGERIIVTELVATMRGLDSFLHGEVDQSEVLDWRLRLRIAAEAARGIEHLHGGAAGGIVHGRVTSSNIMVDAGFCTRVCDYGISFLGGGDNGGASGCWDGEGFDECREGDVYGFGVVLLELLSGRKGEGGAIVAWALPLIRGCRVAELLDPRVGAPFDVRPLERMATVASACVGNKRRSRPPMAQVAAVLSDLETKASI